MSMSHSWSRLWPRIGLLLPIWLFWVIPVEAVGEGGSLELETIDMRPASPAPWSLRHLSAPIVSLFRGPNYMYGVREFRIETTPAHGYVDLFYVRAGFQKRFEQSESPVRVVIPSRVNVDPRDSLTVRAFADGYYQKSVKFKAKAEIDDVVIDLEVLPNTLEALDYRYLAGRTSLSFITSQALTFRLQESDTGYSVILSETSISPDAQRKVEAIRGPRLSEAQAQQLGEDLMLRLVLREDARVPDLGVRSRQAYDSPRGVHVFEIDFIDESAAAASVQHSLDALARVKSSSVQGCAGVFDSVLRAQFSRKELAQALRPRGNFSDRYLRAAMRRLGEVSVDGAVDFEDGNRLRPANPLELELALSNASMANGYLALLRSFVAHSEGDPLSRSQALRSLIAPKLNPGEFAARLAVAESAEQKCDRKGTSKKEPERSR